MGGTAGVTVGMQQAGETDAAGGAVRGPLTHARSHALLGIDFAKPLRLPRCARYYDTFDRPERTCMYVNERGQPFKIEFRKGAVPDFVKWPNAAIATDPRGFVQRMHVDVSTDPKLQGKAVDAMLDTFGPPTRVTSNRGPKVGLWEHDDYVIQQFLDPQGPFVQMDTRKAHDADSAKPPDPPTHLH